MEEKNLNSSLLSLFRLFVGIRLVAGVLAFFAQAEFLNPRFHREPLFWLDSVDALILVVYLSWPWLQKRLGRFYLPLALMLAVVGPVVENYLSAILQSSEDLSAFRALAGQWQLVVVILIPLILIGWDYGYRLAILASLGTALVDIIFLVLPPLSLMQNTRPFPVLGVIIFRTLTFILISYVIVRLSDELRQRNLRLEQANRQLSSYASTLEHLTISRERNRMARELHDTLAHSLSAVAVQLEAVHSLWETNPSAARQMLEGSLTLTRDGLNEARRAIQALRTAPLEDLGLALALKNLATRTTERLGLGLEMEIDENLPAVRPEVEYALYRIGEEALRNAADHAGAKKLLLRLGIFGENLELKVCDDGRGFDTNQIPPEDSYGLRGMQERAEAIGAQLKLSSQPGQGTTVLLSYKANRALATGQLTKQPSKGNGSGDG